MTAARALAGWLLDPAKRKALYGLLGGVGVVLVAAGVAQDSLVTGTVGLVVAVVDFAALLLASWKSQRWEATALYAAGALVVGALKTLGVISDGQQSHTLDVLSAGVGVVPLVVAFLRTTGATPTGEPVVEYQGRHGTLVESGRVTVAKAMAVSFVAAIVAALALVWAPPASAATPKTDPRCAAELYAGQADFSVTWFAGTTRTVHPGDTFKRVVRVYNCPASDRYPSQVQVTIRGIQHASVAGIDTWGHDRDRGSCRVAYFASGALNYVRCFLTPRPGQEAWMRVEYLVPYAPALADSAYHGSADLRYGSNSDNNTSQSAGFYPVTLFAP